MLVVLRHLDADPAVIYAALKTRQIVFQDALKGFTAREVDAWTEALREFDRLSSVPPEQFAQLDIETRRRWQLATNRGDALAE
ncbi:hypothetical protein [Nannocystis bainbridge]|uniref:hypothetical protein n=1 Tax=Nannocystis bainbridge TaxID=2995303 RepID=UPI00232C2DF7|nr:hypothetical protein [Nannocystis bainbridge]